jgi:putative glutamine amidotransferase
VKDLAPGLVAVGWAPDGLIEAVEASGDAFRCAVQWHPEILAPHDQGSRRLFEAFLDACRTGAAR